MVAGTFAPRRTVPYPSNAPLTGNRGIDWKYVAVGPAQVSTTVANQRQFEATAMGLDLSAVDAGPSAAESSSTKPAAKTSSRSRSIRDLRRPRGRRHRLGGPVVTSPTPFVPRPSALIGRPGRWLRPPAASPLPPSTRPSHVETKTHRRRRFVDAVRVRGDAATTRPAFDTSPPPRARRPCRSATSRTSPTACAAWTTCCIASACATSA